MKSGQDTSSEVRISEVRSSQGMMERPQRWMAEGVGQLTRVELTALGSTATCSGVLSRKALERVMVLTE